MRYGADACGAGGEHQQTLLLEFFGEPIGGAPGRIDAEENHVRVNLVGEEPDIFDVFNALGQAACVGVVLGEAFDVMFEGVEGGRGQDAGLPHSAAQDLAVPQGLGDQVFWPAQGGAYRRAQSLAETDTHGVEVFGPTRWLDAGSHGGVKEPCAVEMGS